jgi:hypothetical protein
MPEKVNATEDITDILKRGEELDQLDHLAVAGKPVSDEEFKEIFDSYVNGTYLHRRLEKVQAHKQKLLSKIADLETVEQQIQNRIAKNN